MRSTILLAALGLSSCDSAFDEYLRQFGKSVSGAEYESRRALFEERLARAEELNARPGALWQAGVNGLWDLPQGELRQRFGYNKMGLHGQADQAPLLQAARTPDAVEALPKAVDWRNHTPSVLSPVKSQGGCGSCWAFAAAQAIESSIALNTGILLDLSPQQLNSCTPNPHKCGGSGGCMGATPQLAFDYTLKMGLSDIWNYPYQSGITGGTGECRENQTAPAAMITGYQGVERNSGKALEEAVAKHGPISVSVDASDWFMYSDGIFDGCNKTNPDINHAVQLVGYGEENSTKYWIVRNSWGAEWGEQGFMRLRRYDHEPCGWDVTPLDGFGCEGGPTKIRACGECGILSDPVFAVGGRLSTNPRFRPRRLQAAPATLV